MSNNHQFLDLDPNSRHSFINYWRFEIYLIKAIHIFQYIAILSLLMLYIEKEFIISIFLIIGAAVLHFFLGVWEVLNGIIFMFKDTENQKMRLSYLKYAMGALFLLFICFFLADYIEELFLVNRDIVWVVYTIINIALLPHLVSYYYIKMLRKSIALEKQ